MLIFKRKRTRFIIAVLALLLLFCVIIAFNQTINFSKNYLDLVFTSAISEPLQTIDYKKYTKLDHSVYSKLLDINFKYVLNAKHVCDTSKDILAIFIITSYFGNTEIRNSIRAVFNKDSIKRLPLRKVFLLGETDTDKYTSQKTIELESDSFKDVIQGNFREAYRNLTYKHSMGLKWVGTYCTTAKYVIKMDDDTVVNMHKLKDILNSLDEINSHGRFIAGYKLNKMKPIRDRTNKWYVTPQEYAPKVYPVFVSGWFYVTTPQVALTLAASAGYYKFFWIDDVFLTGIVATALKIRLIDISKYFVVNAEFLQCCLQDFAKAIDCDRYVGPNGGDIKMFFKFNEQAERCALERICVNRTTALNDTCVAEKKVYLGQGDAVIKTIKLK